MVDGNLSLSLCVCVVEGGGACKNGFHILGKWREGGEERRERDYIIWFHSSSNESG